MPKQHPPVILLLGKNESSDALVDDWLAASRYSTLQAADVFQALEHISDFTLGERPDVVYLHVDSASADIAFMQTLVATAAGEPDVPIISLGMEESKKDFETTIAGLACELDRFIPMDRTSV